MTNTFTVVPYSFIRLTEAHQDLLPALEALYRAFAVHEGHTNTVDQFMKAICAQLADDQILVQLAQYETQPAGYLLAYDVSEHPFIPTWQRSGYITQLFVDEAFQRQGIGQRLARQALAWFRERGIAQVMLNVDVGNEHAAHFWQKQGFTPYLTRMHQTLA